MARYATIDIETNIVTNVVEWSGNVPWQPGPGLIAARSDEAGPGWSYVPETGAFSPPDAPQAE